MNGWGRLGIAVAVSLIAHWLIGEALAALEPRPPREREKPFERMRVAVIEEPEPLLPALPETVIVPGLPAPEPIAVAPAAPPEAPAPELAPPPPPPPADAAPDTFVKPKKVALAKPKAFMEAFDKESAALAALLTAEDGASTTKVLRSLGGTADLSKLEGWGLESTSGLGALSPGGSVDGVLGGTAGNVMGADGGAIRAGTAVGPGVADIGPREGPFGAHEVSKMPTMRGDCRGQYTQAARDEGVEGTVVLDVTVTADGRTEAVRVVKGLGHGLDEAAVSALERCRFNPGQREGAAVAVRLRAFKVRFRLDQ